MYIKTWQAKWGNNIIEVSNGWDWHANTEELIKINGEVIIQRYYNAADVSFDRAVGTVFNLDYGEDKIKVVCGHAWYLLGMACRIEVNGKFIGGNKIVLFAKEPSV